jgi:hypothetical protein
MTKFHLVMGGKAQTSASCLVILSNVEEPASGPASIRKKAGAPSMTKFHLVMGGKAQTSTRHPEQRRRTRFQPRVNQQETGCPIQQMGNLEKCLFFEN